MRKPLGRIRSAIGLLNSRIDHGDLCGLMGNYIISHYCNYGKLYNYLNNIKNIKFSSKSYNNTMSRTSGRKPTEQHWLILYVLCVMRHHSRGSLYSLLFPNFKSP